MAIKTLVQNGKINEIMRRQVIGVLREIMSDSDYGLRLQQGIARRLKKSSQSKQSGAIVSLEKILSKYRA